MKIKIVGLFVCMLFIITFLPVSGNMAIKEITTGNDGTLSGYVNDTSMNPIEGALIRVSFHGTYEENYSDSSGYYHVTNIPICWCMKNCTASKVGCKREWVLLAIVENTTHDFILSLSKILFVGGDGPGNYSKIQDAINDANDGDTVFVYDDSSPYNESINVNKSINLIGENKQTTIIEGNGSIDVSADWVTISEFTILYDISLDSCCNNTISDNILSGKSWGNIELSYSCNNKITNNEILNCIHGIELFYSSNNVISGNIISNNGSDVSVSGISLFSSNNNMVTGNSISNCFFGLISGGSRENIIEKNNFIGNKINAIFACSWRDILKGDYWDSNYWDRHTGNRPKIIFGIIGFWGVVPWINLDKNPAKEPYDI